MHIRKITTKRAQATWSLLDLARAIADLLSTTSVFGYSLVKDSSTT